MNFSAVILAGGKSSRMGRDKAFLEFEGTPLLARQVKLAREAGAREIFVSGRANTDYAAFSCPVLLDDFPDAGPLAGMERALGACAMPMLLVLAVDMPHMTASLLRELAARCRRDVGVIPRANGRIEPLAAFYPKASSQLSASLLVSGAKAVTGFAERCVRDGLAESIDLPLGRAVCFANWNAPVDLANTNG